MQADEIVVPRGVVEPGQLVLPWVAIVAQITQACCVHGVLNVGQFSVEVQRPGTPSGDKK